MTKPPIDLLQGTVDVLILRTLAWEPMHGYGVARFVVAKTGDIDVLVVEASMNQDVLNAFATQDVRIVCA